MYISMHLYNIYIYINIHMYIVYSLIERPPLQNRGPCPSGESRDSTNPTFYMPLKDFWVTRGIK